MIADENVSGYIRSLEPDLPDALEKIEKYGHENEVPVIRKEAQSVLRFVIKSYSPVHILEIGTAIGFSACLMAEWSGKETRIVTIEKDAKRAAEASENIKKTNFGDIIELREGDAAEILAEMTEKKLEFDLVFLDAAKAQYGVYFEYIDKLLVPGGIVLTDNVLQEGSVACSKFSVTRRDRTIHKRMREFISAVYADPGYHSMIIPIGDGMMLTQKVKE